MPDFETTLHNEYERLVGLCTYLTGDPDEADDLAQETLIEAWRNQHKLYDPSGMYAWLSAIARNVHLRWKDRRNRQRVLLTKAAQEGEPTVDFELDLEQGEILGLLNEALSLLPVATRDVLVARFIDSLSPAEIASRLGITENNVALRLHRGRGALARAVREEFAFEPDGVNGAWQATSMWCPQCGKHRLEGKLNSLMGTLYLRCPGCYAQKRDVLNATEMLPQVIGGVKGFKAAFTRLSKWSNDYYLPGLRAGITSCSMCKRPVRPRWVAVGEDYRIDASCKHCGGMNFTTLTGASFALPESQRFWREHPHVRLLPFEHLQEIEGQPGVVVAYECLDTGRRIETVFGLHTYHFLHIEER